MKSTGQRAMVVGAGYVGLTTAIGLATAGHHIELVEISADRLDALRAGRLPINEPGLQNAFDDLETRSRISLTDAPSATGAEIILLCVGTPLDDEGRADLSQMEAALDSVGNQLAAGAILVIRSTLPVGSTERLLTSSRALRSRTFTNPEFLRQGRALHDFMHPTRLVIGRFPDADEDALARVLALLHVDGTAPLRVVSVVEADLIKNGANAFLALKLSFANELATVCEEISADIDVVLDGIGLDPRIGGGHLRPSFGFGGSCLPKELATLAITGRRHGLPMHVTAAAAEANASHQRRFAERVLAEWRDPRGKRVGLLGLAFKSGTDDVRSSPALELARTLIEHGVKVFAHDPLAGAGALRALPGLVLAPTPEEALAESDLGIIATEWPIYADLDWRAIRQTMRSPVIFDGRRLLDGQSMARDGFRYEAVGSRAGAAPVSEAVPEAVPEPVPGL